MLKEKKENAISESKVDVLPSLYEFVKEMNKGGHVTSVMDENLKKHRVSLKGDFLLSELLVGKGTKELPDHMPGELHYVVLDSDYGFLLGFKTTEESRATWTALTSFSCRRKQEGPTIEQLQGCTGKGDLPQRRKKIRKIMENYNWEIALVSLVRKWAISQDFDYAFILPASLNPNLSTFPLKRAQVRYDQTARRCGFRQENPQDLFELKLK